MASIGLGEKPDILSGNSEKRDSIQGLELTNQNFSDFLIKEDEKDEADSSLINVEEAESQGTNTWIQKEESGDSNILTRSEIIVNDDQGEDKNQSQEIRGVQSDSSSVDIQDIERLSRQLLVEGPISQIVHSNEVSIRLKLNKLVITPFI